MSFSCRVLACALAAAWLLSGNVLSAAGPIICVSYCDVPFEIVEGVPDKKSWDFEAEEPTTRFDASAFAVAAIPKKYTASGVIADRQVPFVVRGKAKFALPAGEYRFLLRARGAARLLIDGKVIAETKFRVPSDNGHGLVPDLPVAEEPGLAPLPPENQERLVTVALDGKPHEFRLETIVGDQKLRPELGELSVSVAKVGETPVAGEPSFKLLGNGGGINPLNESNWAEYKRVHAGRVAELDKRTRREAAAGQAEYWNNRHKLARDYWQSQPPIRVPDTPAYSDLSPIDRFLLAGQQKEGQQFAKLLDDSAFLRRVSLDTVGTLPTAERVSEWKEYGGGHERARLIESMIENRRWADHWTSYCQDVLAENPGILKPELNNTGAFRWWIHESLEDNKPFDRFATELVMMEGSSAYGGPAGFAVATQNDAAMAEKAHVLCKAFLAIELKCARCHDAPYHPFKQHDTFSLAAMLDRKPQTLPKTSTVPLAEGDRKPLISISLKPGDKIEPQWPFEKLDAADLPDGILRNPDDSRERFAAMLTSPANKRFAEVIVNRVWTRYMGWGLVSSADDWTAAEHHYPELLDYLARDFIEHNYDLKHLARTILNSRAYQSAAVPLAASDDERRRSPIGPARRRMSAEQLVDSLFVAVGKRFDAEELTFDPAGRSPARQFGNLGHAEHAWQFTSLSNERDRPALSMPRAQSIVDLLVTFGWRESRQNPLTLRDESPNVLQPLLLANGVVGARIASLSDDSAITTLALSDVPLDELIERVYLRVLSRPPNAQETETFVQLLSDGYAERRVANAAATKPTATPRHAVAWSNHLSPEASRIKLEMERVARAGDPPTAALAADWRERMEDMVWALVNSPEFVFVP
jgi:hypothetical protein